MRFDNRFRYRQAHAGTLDAMPLICPSIEFSEDAVDFLGFDSRPVVRDADEMKFVVFLCRDPNWLAWGGVKLRVSDQVN
jgi:hypothetical protein